MDTEENVIKSIEDRKREIKQYRMDELNLLFDGILRDDSHLLSLMKTHAPDKAAEFEKKLTAYHVALIHEIQFLNISYDHPLRAARALAVLNNPKESANFIKNLNNFIEQSSNSGFYPRIHVAARVVADFLVLCIPMLIPAMLVSAGVVSFPLMSPIMIAVLALWAVALPISYDSAKRAVRPVFDAIDGGKALHPFFKPFESNIERDLEIEVGPVVESLQVF